MHIIASLCCIIIQNPCILLLFLSDKCKSLLTINFKWKKNNNLKTIFNATLHKNSSLCKKSSEWNYTFPQYYRTETMLSLGLLNKERYINVYQHLKHKIFLKWQNKGCMTSYKCTIFCHVRVGYNFLLQWLAYISVT